MKSAKLTDRELQVMKLLTLGMPNKEIAQKLRISKNTVDRHLASIYRKLDVHNRTEAVLRYIDPSEH